MTRLYTLKKSFFFCFLIVCFFSISSVHAATYYAVTSGSWTGAIWSTSANGSAGIISITTSDIIIINNGVTVTVSGTSNCASISITTGGAASGISISGSTTLNVAGNIDINDGSPNIFAVNSGTLNAGGNVSISGNGNRIGKLTVGSGIVNIAGNFSFNSGGGGNASNQFVDVTGGGIISISGSLVNATNGTISTAAYASIDVPGAMFKAFASGAWGASGTWGKYIPGTSMLVYETSTTSPTNGALKIEINSGFSVTGMPNIVMTNASTSLTVAGSLDCGINVYSGTGTFELQSGATLLTGNAIGIASSGSTGSIQVSGIRTFPTTANYTYNGTNQITGAGLPATVKSLVVNSTGTVSLTSSLATDQLSLQGGTFFIGTNTLTLNSTVTRTSGLLNSAATGSVNYSQSTSGQAVISGAYGNLTFNGQNKVLSSSGTIGVAGTFTPGSATGHTTTGSTVDFNGTVTVQSIPSATYNNLTISGSGNKSLGSSTIVINNTLSATGGSMDGSTSSVSFTSATATLNGLSNKDFYNLTIPSGVTLTSTAVSGNNIKIKNSYTNNGTFIQNTLNTTSFSGTQTLSGSGASTFGNLTVQNGSILNAASHNITVNGEMTVSSGGTFNGGSGITTFSGNSSFGSGDGTVNLNHITIPLGAVLSNVVNNISFQVSGNWINNGTYTNGSETATFNGTSNQNLSGTSTTPFTNLAFSGSGTTKTISGVTTVSTLLSLGSSTTVNSTSGNLTLLSTADRSANIAAIPFGSSITGDISVHTFITGGSSTKRYGRMLSPPINDILTTAPNKVYQQLKGYMIITGPGGATNNFDPGNNLQPNAVTLTKYNEPATLSAPQFSPIASLSTASVPTAKPGEGFFLFFRGDRTGYTTTTASTSKKLNALIMVPEDVKMVYRGVPNQGNISVNITKTVNGDIYDGLNVVGNPYAGTIDFQQLVSTNSGLISAQYIILHPDNVNGAMTYSAGVLNNGVTKTPAEARYIQPGQGFYIRKVDTGPGFLIFTESLKSVTNSPARMMSVPSAGMSPVNVKANNDLKVLRLNLQNGISKDETTLVFNGNYKAEYDGADAPYLSGSSVSLSSFTSDNRALSINFMPEMKEESVIKLKVDASASGSVSLNFTDLSAVGPFQIFLKDAYLNEVIDAKLNRTYAFTIDKKNAATFGADRFSLIFKAPIPVEILNFTAAKVKWSSEIKWVTENESNTDYFEVERSIDNVTFQKIASIAKPISEIGAATSVYNYTDDTPQVGTNYYRLRQVDMQGKFTFTDTLSLVYEKIEEVKKEDFKFSVYPNPTVDELRVKLAERTDQAVTMNVYDLQGLKIKSTTFQADQELVQNVSDLTANMYILEVRDKSDSLLGKAKFIKQ